MKKMTKLVSMIAAMAIASSPAAMCVSAEDTAAAVTTSVSAPVTTNPFADTYHQWYEEAVVYVYSLGLVKGVSDTEFKPDANVTGAEFATILYRIYCLETNKEADDSSKNWDEPAMEWVENNKLAEGITAFDFSKALKREEVMTLVYNAYKLNHEVEDSSGMILTQFVDGSKVSEYAKSAVRWNIEQGIIEGDDTNSLLPESNVTRAETAAVIMRYIENCGFTFSAADGPGTENPMKEYKTLAEAETASGLTMPEFKVDKYTAEKYFTISETDAANAILQEEGKYDSKNTVIRYGLGDRAIGGFHGAETMDEVPDGISVTYQKLGNVVSAEWVKTVDGKIYCFSVAIEDGTADDLTVFVNAIGAEQVVQEK